MDKEILKALLDNIEDNLKKVEAGDERVANECLVNIDFGYETLRRFNQGCLPWGDNRFEELNERFDKLKGGRNG